MTENIHQCNWIKAKNHYHSSYPEEIGLVEKQWTLHRRGIANQKWVEDGEAKFVGEALYDYSIKINFCPYCGMRLEKDLEASASQIHKPGADLHESLFSSPLLFPQCQAIKDNFNKEEKWFVIKDIDDDTDIWLLENFIAASPEMVSQGEADYAGELIFRHGFDILYCPFCGELLDNQRKI
jgi:sarcosine oxidase delta subunit